MTNKKFVHPELRKAIVIWLFDHESTFNRCNACRENFKNYIYDANGQYVFGGEDVSKYITEMDEHLFS